MDGEGEIDLEEARRLSDRRQGRFPAISPQRTFSQHQRFQLRKNPAQPTNLHPVCDRIAIQVQLSDAFMGTGGLSIAIAARRTLRNNEARTNESPEQLKVKVIHLHCRDSSAFRHHSCSRRRESAKACSCFPARRPRRCPKARAYTR
jgi:hypothetical protein